MVPSRRASRVRRASAGLSSTSRTSQTLLGGASNIRFTPLGDRQGELKAAALTGDRVDPDLAAVVLYDLLDDRQTDAGAGILVAVVQPLKNQENFVHVLFFNPEDRKSVV